MRSSRRARRSKRQVAISKRIVVRSIKGVQVKKKWSEVHRKCFPLTFAERTVGSNRWFITILQSRNTSHKYCQKIPFIECTIPLK